MATIVRKFITDPDGIYFCSGGTLLRETVFDFISYKANRIASLTSTKNNVGWVGKNTVIMVTENDELLRIDCAVYAKMLRDSETEILSFDSVYGSGDVLTIRYNSLKFTDHDFKADDSYKAVYPMKIGECFVTQLPEVEGSVIITSNINFIYSVHDRVVSKFERRHGLAVYGPMCDKFLENSDEHTGYLKGLDGSLIISDDMIKRADRVKIMEMLADQSTVCEHFDHDERSYMVMSYDSNKYTDEYLGATTEYKK